MIDWHRIFEALVASTLGEKNPDKSRFGSAFEAGLFGAPLRSQDTEMLEVTVFFLFSKKSLQLPGPFPETDPPEQKNLE